VEAYLQMIVAVAKVGAVEQVFAIHMNPIANVQILFATTRLIQIVLAEAIAAKHLVMLEPDNPHQNQ
jgi:hypothetical protein